MRFERRSSFRGSAVRKDKDKVFGEKEKVFGEKEKVFGEKEKVFGEKEKVFGKQEKVFGEKEKVFGEQEKVFGECPEGLRSHGLDYISKVFRQVQKARFQRHLLDSLASGAPGSGPRS